jgi:hypothetical protein
MLSWKFYKNAFVIGSLVFALTTGPGSSCCWAAIIGVIGTPISLTTLLVDGETLTVDDKVFSEFEYTFTGEMPAPAGVNVIPIQDSDGNFGIRFQGGFMDLPSSQGPSDALIEYNVASTGRLISDAHLIGNPNVLGDVGSISVTETFLPLGPGGQYTMEIFDDENLNMAVLMDQVFFMPPVQMLSVQKDILAIAVAGSQSVTLSFVDQTFSQIPEPITLASLIAGVIAIGLVRRGRSRPHHRI